LVNHGLPAPAHWWKAQTWARLRKLWPEWVHAHLETYRPVLRALDEQIDKRTAQLEAAAPAEIPRGFGKLTTVAATREVCDWGRFANRRQVSSYPGWCPGEPSSGSQRVLGRVTKHGNPRLQSRTGRARMATGPFPAPGCAGAKAAALLGQGRESHRRGAQEGDPRRGAVPGRGPVAAAHRALHRRAAWPGRPGTRRPACRRGSPGRATALGSRFGGNRSRRGAGDESRMTNGKTDHQPRQESRTQAHISNLKS